MKITDTIDAKILTILSDWFEHDADRMADAMLEIKELVHQELENIFLEMEKVVGEDETDENTPDHYDNYPDQELRGKRNELRKEQRQLLANLKQEYLGKGKE